MFVDVLDVLNIFFDVLDFHIFGPLGSGGTAEEPLSRPYPECRRS